MRDGSKLIRAEFLRPIAKLSNPPTRFSTITNGDGNISSFIPFCY